MGFAIPQQIMLETVACCACGIVFAMPDYLISHLQKEGGSFYCPNGHSQHYTKTEVMELREMLEQTNRKNTSLVAEIGRAKQEAENAKKETNRLMNRAKSGVCPCCHRTVKQMARHIATKHPEFKS